MSAVSARVFHTTLPSASRMLTSYVAPSPTASHRRTSVSVNSDAPVTGDLGCRSGDSATMRSARSRPGAVAVGLVRKAMPTRTMAAAAAANCPADRRLAPRTDIVKVDGRASRAAPSRARHSLHSARCRETCWRSDAESALSRKAAIASSVGWSCSLATFSTNGPRAASCASRYWILDPAATQGLTQRRG